MNSQNKYVGIVLLSALSLTTYAQDKKDMFNPVNSAVTSQSIAPDARAGGMGDVGAATDPDVASQYWNPAKYPFTISRAGVSLNYTPWLRQLVNDMDLAYLSGYYRIGDYSAVSASLRYFSLGEVQISSSLDNTGDMTINPYEMSVDVGYSLMLSETFSLGAAVGKIAGVELLAYSIQSLVEQKEIHKVSGAAFWIISLLIVLLIEVMQSRYLDKTKHSPNEFVRYVASSPYVMNILTYLFTTVFIGASFVVFSKYHVSFNLAWALSTIAFLGLSRNMYNSLRDYFQSIKDKHKQSKNISL